MRVYLIVFIVSLCFFGNGFGQGLATDDAQMENVKVLQLMNQINELIIEGPVDHCEVPCGIYGDSLRISLIREHSSTIEKAMNQINELSKEASPNYNQLIRWVNNKEKHAEEIQNIVSQYFLHQRVKAPKAGTRKDQIMAAQQKYFNQLSSLHAILVSSMKCKQSTDLNQVGDLNTAISDFESYYFHGHKH